MNVAIPVLRVSNSSVAEEFYCHRLGFRLEFVHRADENKADPCYMGITRDGAWLHISSFPGDGVFGGVAYILVKDVDALHAEFLTMSIRIAVGPTDQTWGSREMYIRDADRNCIRFASRSLSKPVE